MENQELIKVTQKTITFFENIEHDCKEAIEEKENQFRMLKIELSILYERLSLIKGITNDYKSKMKQIDFDFDNGTEIGNFSDKLQKNPTT